MILSPIEIPLFRKSRFLGCAHSCTTFTRRLVAHHSYIFLIISFLAFCCDFSSEEYFDSPDLSSQEASEVSCITKSKTEAVSMLAGGDFAAALHKLMETASGCQGGGGAADPELWQGLGSALYGMGLPGHAGRAFRAAHLLAPHDADHRNNIAACFIDTGRTRDAVSLLRGPAAAVEAALRAGAAAAAAAAAAGGWKTLLNLASALAEEGRVEAGAARLAALLALPAAGAGAALHRHVALANLLYSSLSTCAWAGAEGPPAPATMAGARWGAGWTWAAWERDARGLCEAQAAGRLDALAPSLPVRGRLTALLPAPAPPSLVKAEESQAARKERSEAFVKQPPPSSHLHVPQLSCRRKRDRAPARQVERAEH
jgi:hypothetical protein